jgi:hypothetical protein
MHADVQAILSQHAMHAHTKDFKHKNHSISKHLEHFLSLAEHAAHESNDKGAS